MVNHSASAASTYRSTVCNLIHVFKAPNNESWEECFHAYLEDRWQQEIEKFEELKLSQESKEIIAETSITLYIYAVGLVAYGHLEVVSFMLRNIPNIGKLPRLARVVLELAPIPDEVRDTRNWETIAEWMDKNIDNLEWNNERQIFTFK
jgi:hypothetical protein